MNVIIKRLSEDDWFEFSQIRLEALQTDPQAFGSNYQKESPLTEADWRNRLRGNAIFLICEAETPIGMTAVGIDRDDESGKTAILWGSWLAPSFRRQGLSELMYQIRIEWAKAQPTVERLVVAHRASNLAAQNAIRKHGFLETRRENFVWADGGAEDLVSCELKIKL